MDYVDLLLLLLMPTSSLKYLLVGQGEWPCHFVSLNQRCKCGYASLEREEQGK